MVLDPLGGVVKRTPRVPRIVFSDLDDTFLTHDKRVTPENSALLDEFERRGIQFVPCSGRVFGGIPKDLCSRACVDYAVSANGAVITDTATGEPVASWLLPVESVKRLYEKVKDLDVTFDVFVEGRAYSERARYDRLDTFNIPPHQVAFLRSDRIQLDITIPEFLDQLLSRPQGLAGVERMSTHYKDPEVFGTVTALVDADPSIHWASSGRWNIEINDIQTSKGTALVWLCDRLGIDIADSIAFGDNLNDVSMIEAAGRGVVVDNGTEAAKAAADALTASCEESGVAAFFKKEYGF